MGDWQRLLIFDNIMGRTPRERPKNLAGKLLAIRQRLKLSQNQFGKNFGMNPRRLSEYELGRREPNLRVLLRYARAGKVRLEIIIDDDLELPF